MSKRYMPAAIALVASLALVASACSKKSGGTSTGGLKAGGTLRIQTDDFLWTGNLDPTGEYLGNAWEWFSLMHRPLLGFNHKAGKEGGNDVIPDAATDLGQVSADGKTYTFKIRPGIKFQPPLNRAVTSKDYATAFKRLANTTFNATGYPSYYQTTIVGFDEFSKLKPEDQAKSTISGIETPDDSTIVFHLTQPTGDFRYRLAMPATSPMPDEVAKCITKAGDYGNWQVASGPYMLKGSDTSLNFSSCDALLKSPHPGFDPTDHLIIVRNPSYDPSTDSKEARENFLNEIDLTKNTNTDDIFKRIGDNLVDTALANPSPAIITQYLNSTTLKDKFHIDPGDRTWYLFMNLAIPPFDDVHVRRALNWVLDKAAMVRVRGGAAAGVPAEHIVPPDVLGGLLKAGEFDPYASPDHAGDAAKAMEEMKQSKYDKNHDGKCDESPECRNVVYITRSKPIYVNMAPIVASSFAKLGITLATRTVDNFYKAVQVTKDTPALGGGAGWGKDYADASTFFDPLLASAAISKDATQNYSLLGLTRQQATDFGVKYPSADIPSADNDIKACDAKLGDERKNCWADLDKKMMTDYLPWVPYMWAFNDTVVSDAIQNYTYDQFSGMISLSHIALDTSKQK